MWVGPASGGTGTNDSNWSARTPNSTSAVTIPNGVSINLTATGDQVNSIAAGSGDVLNLFGSLQVFFDGDAGGSEYQRGYADPQRKCDHDWIQQFMGEWHDQRRRKGIRW